MVLRLLGLGLVILLLLSILTPAEEITKTDHTIVFTDISKTDRSLVLNLPSEAAMSYFSFELTGPIEPGIEQPWNLRLDIGDNGTVDWALKREYGLLGNQKVFNNDNEQLERRFIPGNYNDSGGIYLPVGAEISSATMDLIYSAEDYISPVITELNRPEWHPEAPYDYDPAMEVFQDRLYVAYRTYNWHDTNQSDADIALNSTSDGIQWQDRTIELTKAPDTEVPYFGGKRSGDFRPSMTVFNNRLYCAWESTSPEPIGSTTGEDRDIVWSRYDGNVWLDPRELTAPNEHAAENKYSENPGTKDDRDVQLCTFNNGTGEQLFAIWTANNTGDEKFPGGWLGDIVVSRTTDGLSWTTGLDLTYDDRRLDNDTQPQLIEFKTPMGNALFAFWVTDNLQLTNGSDLDIAYRYTLDGVSWSGTYNLIDACAISESVPKNKANDEDPAVVVYDNKLFVLWRTANPTITNGDDVDIVLVHSADGMNWSGPIEITPNTDSMFNNRPRAAIFQNKLAVGWRTVQPEDLGAIILRVYDNVTAQWSKSITISPKGMGGDDYRHDMISFGDKLMVTWVTEDNITTLGTESDVVVRWLVPNDGKPEIALDIGYKNKFNEKWLTNKIEYIEGIKNNIDFTLRLQNLLQNSDWLAANKFTDEYNNEIVMIPINTFFSSPGKITLDSLQISYNYTLSVPDLSAELTEFLKSSSSDEEIEVILRFESDTNGKIKIQNLKVVYTSPDQSRDNPEIICIMIIGIILIIVGILIRFAKFGKRQDKTERSKKSNKE